MLTRVINHVIESFFGRLPAIVHLGPATVLPNISAGFQIRDLLDGIVLATPKNRTPIRKILARRYGDDNWKYGQKLWKPKRTIVSCATCGSFHELHTICRHCFKKVEEESKYIMEKIRAAWRSDIIDKDVQVVYQGEAATSTTKRIVELEKPRPIWFAPNLSQKTAQPAAQITGPPIESENRTIKLKDTNTETAT